MELLVIWAAIIACGIATAAIIYTKPPVDPDEQRENSIW
jgi:hypothetical protein